MSCGPSTGRSPGVSNVSYHGPYAYPTGLAEVYESCDLVWSQDLWQSGANSDWLLPNRIYEASYFGCLSIAVAGTETAAKVAAEELGYTIPAPTGQALVDLVEGLDPAEVEERRRRRLLAKDPAAFVGSDADVRRMVDTRSAASPSAARGRGRRRRLTAAGEAVLEAVMDLEQVLCRGQRSSAR